MKSYATHNDRFNIGSSAFSFFVKDLPSSFKHVSGNALSNHEREVNAASPTVVKGIRP